MSIQDLGSIGEFLSSIAVLISLVYLALQIRKSTAEARSRTVLEVIGTGTAIDHQTADSPVVVAMIKLDNGERLTPEESRRYLFYLQATWHQLWQIYYQHSKGYLEDAILDAYANRVALNLNNSLAKAIWKAMKPGYPTDFQDFIERNAKMDENAA